MKGFLVFVCLVVAAVSANPDNQTPMIAFIANQNGFNEIAIVPADGSSPPRILTDMKTTHVEQPRLSRSRQTIVFSSDYESSIPILYTIDVNGGVPLPLTSTVEGAQVAADWAPDDSLLVMEEIHEETEYTRLVLIDATGENRFLITMGREEEEEEEEVNQQHNDFFARWSPRGDAILFMSDREVFHPEFYIFSLRQLGSPTLARQKLSHLPPLVHYPMGNGPSFSPTGDRFIFEEEREAHFVNLVENSMGEQDIKHLFSVDVIQKPNELNDLSLSQCVYSPLPSDSNLCCRYLRTDDSNAVLALVSTEGTIVKTLTSEDMSASAPSWK